MRYGSSTWIATNWKGEEWCNHKFSKKAKMFEMKTEHGSVDASFVGDGNGKLWNVPDSRADMFKNKSLTLMEKNQLMRFFKLVMGREGENFGRGFGEAVYRLPVENVVASKY
ncbi:hypothetical protein OIU77_019083 [Salix suchowensis]|uniref:Uncharacterized protein n=1 Tax=Salix suchowensis TaxID=1278906 RepID=A0ABQ9CEP8_9ROSI|nr:hypothetical protein OIU77_019083 [Salix suchowensis]